jgi:hypothetical protein
MERGCAIILETMKRRLLQLTGVGRWEWVETNGDGFRSTTKMHALSVRWIHHTQKKYSDFIETMQRRLLQLTGVGRWVESNGDGFGASKKQTHALSV